MTRVILRRLALRAAQVTLLAAGMFVFMLLFSHQARAAVSNPPTQGIASAVTHAVLPPQSSSRTAVLAAAVSNAVAVAVPPSLLSPMPPRGSTDQSSAGPARVAVATAGSGAATPPHAATAAMARTATVVVVRSAVAAVAGSVLPIVSATVAPVAGTVSRELPSALASPGIQLAGETLTAATGLISPVVQSVTGPPDPLGGLLALGGTNGPAVTRPPAVSVPARPAARPALGPSAGVLSRVSMGVGGGSVLSLPLIQPVPRTPTEPAGGAPGPGGAASGLGSTGQGGVQAGASAVLIALLVLVLLRLAGRAAHRPIWRCYLPEVPPA